MVFHIKEGEDILLNDIFQGHNNHSSHKLQGSHTNFWGFEANFLLLLFTTLGSLLHMILKFDLNQVGNSGNKFYTLEHLVLIHLTGSNDQL